MRDQRAIRAFQHIKGRGRVGLAAAIDRHVRLRIAIVIATHRHVEKVHAEDRSVQLVVSALQCEPVEITVDVTHDCRIGLVIAIKILRHVRIIARAAPGDGLQCVVRAAQNVEVGLRAGTPDGNVPLVIAIVISRDDSIIIQVAGISAPLRARVSVIGAQDIPVQRAAGGACDGVIGLVIAVKVEHGARMRDVRQGHDDGETAEQNFRQLAGFEKM